MKEYIKLDLSVLQCDLSDQAKLLYGYLMTLTYENSRRCELNLEDYARRLNKSERTIRRIIKELEERNIVIYQKTKYITYITINENWNKIKPSGNVGKDFYKMIL